MTHHDALVSLFDRLATDGTAERYESLHDDIARIPALEILLNTPAVQKYILEAREGELLQIIKQSHEEGMVDFTTSLVRLVEDEFIHQDVALGATPKPEELKMRLKGIS